MSPSRLRALIVVCVLALTACMAGSTGADAATPSRAPGTLHWRKCTEGQCARLKVPLDAAVPEGKQISLALARVRANDPSRRIGSLVINPGGPGAPGAEYVQAIASELPESITDRFDIVGWDPRGSGHSAPVKCGTHLDYLFAADTAPADPAEEAALEAASRRFAQDCASGSGDLLAHIASIDSVHDLDRIRAALGEDTLTYAGFSYGTYLGALYAQEYPDHVRALLLDGAVDPAVPIDEVSIQQAMGFEASLDAFLADCARKKSCAFHHGGNPRAALDALRARVEQAPIPGDDGRTLGPTQFDIALAAPLYSGAGGYRLLATGLRNAERGDPAQLLAIFDNYVNRDPDGTYSPEWPAFLAISCADGPNIDAASVVALQARAAKAAPYFGSANVGLGLACSYWPNPAVNAASAAVSAPGAPPIVVVGTTGDPATPIAWAQGLTRELGDARLITVRGTTHTSSLDGNPCLDAAITRYLVHLRPPRAGLRCGA